MGPALHQGSHTVLAMDLSSLPQRPQPPLASQSTAALEAENAALKTSAESLKTEMDQMRQVHCPPPPFPPFHK